MTPALTNRNTAATAAQGAPTPSAADEAPKPISHRQRSEESALLRRYATTRAPGLREELVQRFMPLARSLALRYRGGTEPLDDLVQVAGLGLVKAIDGFDPERGRPFTAYAVPTILGELRRHFRDHVWNLHLPRSLQERTMAVDGAVTDLTEKHGRTPTVAQIAEWLEISQEDVLDALRAAEARRTLSLDAPALRDEDDSAAVVDTVGIHELGFDRVEADDAARSAGLDAREWRVLRLRFVENLNQYEIGAQLGVSQMQISRIMRRALRKLLGAVNPDAGRDLPAEGSGTRRPRQAKKEASPR
jgi:RNA polymerase sigma-B factor